MSKHYRYLFILLTIVILSAGVVVYAIHNCSRTGLFPLAERNIAQYDSIDRPPKIRPDYCETVIPPNIAPLNFLVEERGSQYCVKIHSKKGRAIQIFSHSPKIMIPQDRWHELLNANRGEQLNFDIFVKTANPRLPAPQWNRFSSITNKIANEDIDGFLVYRRIYPGHGFWRKMGIYQRDLHRFDESLILENNYFKGGCLNCHSFCNNRTDKMFIGIRSALYGSSVLHIEDGEVNKIGTKFGYTSWHPSGKVAAYSINKVHQFFHTAATEVRDVIDLDSLLAYYKVDSKTIKTSAHISKKDRLETYPCWSPDGRYLYFCSAPKTWSDQGIIPGNFNEIKYDLVRVSYDMTSDTWGEVETVLSAQDTGLSILLPRISPDGRWLLFCMCNYGCFPVYQQSSDLYIIDLEAAQRTGKYEYRRLDANSDKSESWHSFSSNGRWIAFSSKRQSGVFTRTYISYIDRQGRSHPPLLLPQKDPTYYDSCLWTYSVPELILEPVNVKKEQLGSVVRGTRKIPGQIPITMATPKAGLPNESSEPWLGGRE
ncbi:MAG: hypothetical protein GY845_29545 [Planctomycetes bacterium]|nr:hypothetical protein [Planctomycetota bacterium]